MRRQLLVGKVARGLAEGLLLFGKFGRIVRELGHCVHGTGPFREGFCGGYLRLMVVLTPWLRVSSSNQRAVTVLVWV